MPRRLIAVPILHTAVDLGSLADAVRDRYVRVLGPSAWTERERTVDELWQAIRARVDALRLDYHAVLIYQDGLPVCGHELEIVRELAGAGSRNHQLILALIERGATLMGTEDPQLLLREYQMHRRSLGGAAAEPAAAPVPSAEAAELLELRDAFIAARIAETLPSGQTGLLFLGAAHRWGALVARGLNVETLS
ncbi:MAG: hypothetical protein ABSG68_05860 [Thermoguttaceae bacterium]